ncbi:hypothetical protein Tco_1113556 [Tanacetum coccineum]|uniref:Secreted protein n=1 Tax=Tanacetum coccineum TaxID=301880 RepID=A0ABQ5ISH8_9ASTR
MPSGNLAIGYHICICLSSSFSVSSMALHGQLQDSSNNGSFTCKKHFLCRVHSSKFGPGMRMYSLLIAINRTSSLFKLLRSPTTPLSALKSRVWHLGSPGRVAYHRATSTGLLYAFLSMAIIRHFLLPSRAASAAVNAFVNHA